MTSRYFAAVAFAGLLGLGVSAMGAAPTAPKAPTPPKGAPAAAPAVPAATTPGGLTILDFKPAFDDLMTMLIQPRHMKLYYAGQQKNWTLAAFELNEMQAAFTRIGNTIPKYGKFDVNPTIQSIMGDKMRAVNAAIKSANPQQFATSYAELTDACNGCHQGLDHGFLVVKTPDPNGYPNQDFRPSAPAK